MQRHSIIRTAVVVGALLGVILPFVAGGGSVSFFTDIEARIGYRALAVLVYAAFGALAGWAVGSVFLHFLPVRDRSPQ